MLRLVLAPAVLLVACKGGGSDRGDPPNAPATPVHSDAAVLPSPPTDGGVTTLPTFDPSTGFHLDDTPVVRSGTRIAARDRKPAQLLLRSTPAGAIAAVDGVRLGPTPVLWEGLLDGLSHEFTFVMAGHALARYKFVPVTSGIVHGTLVKLTDDRDAGVPEIPPVQPQPTGAGRSGASVTPERPSAPPVDAAPPPPPPIDAPAPPPIDAAIAPSPFNPPP